MNSFFPTKPQRRLLAPLFYIALIILTTSTVSAAQSKSYDVNRELELWRTFKPASGKFSVSLPGIPENVPQSVELEGTQVEAYGLRTSTSGYVLFYVSRARNAQEEDIFKLAFENFPAAVEKLNDLMMEKNLGFVVSQKNISTPKTLIYEIVAENGATRYKTRYYFSQNTFYGVQIITPVLHNIPAEIAKVYQAESDKFFNSFQIVNNKPQTVRKNK